jgi:DNA-binding MarR family transcriptional regulator
MAELTAEVRGWQGAQELFDSTVADLAGLNRTDWRCLDILTTRGPITPGQLAEAVQLTTGAVTGVLDRLEGAGLVRRVRDTTDRRRLIIETTDELRRQAALVYGPFVADSDEALSVFDADQLDVIVDFVRRERELLTRHTARVRQEFEQQGLGAGRDPTPDRGHDL